MDEPLTIEELSARTGEPADELRRWASLGLIGAGDDRTFRLEDLDRARLVQLLLRRGIALDVIVETERRSPFLALDAGRTFPRHEGPTFSLAEAAEQAGLEVEVAQRFWQSGDLGDESELDQDDIAMLRTLRSALDAGFPVEALFQLFRVYADSLERLAEANTRAFHFYIHEPLRAAAESVDEIRMPTQALSDQLWPLVEPALLYFYRKGQDKAQRDDLVMHVAQEAGLTAFPEAPGQMTRALVFTDLASFTPLTDAMGDQEAATVVERFSDLVRQAANRWDGRVVKQMGDAFMLAFSDAKAAVCCALAIESGAAAEAQFPAARSGVHWGDVLYREGDYVGTNVNIASRVAGEAERHQVLVTAAARKQAGSIPGIEFARLGKRRLRGLAEDVDLFEARSGAPGRGQKSIDPVCGMELGPEEPAARLTLDGQERAFCSDECLRRFVAAPERYAT